MVLRFGDFVLDTAARALRRGDAAIDLRPKTFDLLVLLVEKSPEALSKADLLERVWPGTYVQEVNLSNAIGELRKALGDRGSSAPLIRTVHGFGYAFDAEVKEERPHAPARRGAGGMSLGGRLVWGTTVFPLAAGEWVVGRDDSADIVLQETTVSRRHARIVVNGALAVVEDLGSQNGTWVNDQRVSGPTALSDGDDVRFGLVLVTYRAAAPAFTTKRIPTS
jgi:DNA-binding winged helix-turn-helix (wHTH) protein